VPNSSQKLVALNVMASSQSEIPFRNVIFSDAVRPSDSIDLTNIKDKTILITGGASGFGAAFFREWAARGANVIIGDINERMGTELVAELRRSTGNANHHFIRLDVTNWQSQASFFKEASKLSPHGGIDCVVANAGIADGEENAQFEVPPDYSSMENPPAPRMKTLDVNLYGVMYTTTLALSYLSRNPGSEACSVGTCSRTRDRHLVLVASIAGLAPLPSQPIYATSKHGVVGLFRSLRFTAPIQHGIRVNMLHPYFVDTPILGSLGTVVLAGGGMAKIEDVVHAATRLVADQSVIGRALIIGGRADVQQVKAAGLQPADSLDKDHAIWDVYAHDFEQSDLFTRRIIAVTNLVTAARGWAGLFSDVSSKITATFWRLFGG